MILVEFTYIKSNIKVKIKGKRKSSYTHFETF